MKNTSALFGMVLASALTLPVAEATAAVATVVYTLQENVGGGGGFAGTLPTADFIQTDTTFPIGDFSSISSNPFHITSVEFAPDVSGGGCTNTGPSTCDLIQLSDGSDYGFPVGTFSQFGQNTSSVPDGEITMALTVSPVGVSTVPEPSTWAMMLLGFGLLGGASYWTRRRSVAVAA
jgi:hypothetical protein